MTAQQGALEGLKVLDLTRILAGPLCTMMLGDMGADVIKVEPPGTGDSSRRSMGTGAFLAVNRNKRSVALDLKDAAHREAFLRLADGADVVLENNLPGVAARLGVDAETLRARNPRLVYASISGFGQTGPYAQRAGYDLIAQGLSGVMSVTGEPDGDPIKCGIPVGDLSAALFCAVGILSALAARERTGEGQVVDTSLFEGALALSIWETAELWATGRAPGKLGSAHRLTAPYQALRTADGHLTVAGNTQPQWEKLCAVIGREELVDDARFTTNADRMANRPQLVAELEAALAADTTDAWVARLEEAGIAAGPIHDYAEVFADPHTRAREMEVTVEHPEEGTVRGLGIPVKLSATPGSVRRAAPLLGEHTAEVLREAGLSDAEIAAL
jgi:formyl-CoA transferase